MLVTLDTNELWSIVRELNTKSEVYENIADDITNFVRSIEEQDEIKK